MTEIRKFATVIRFSDEYLHMLNGTDDRPGHLEPPSAEELAAYEAWKAAFEPLYREGARRRWFSPGGPDYGFEYEPPADDSVFDDEETNR